MKTGEKTDPVLQRLMRALSWEEKAEGTKPAEGSQAPEADKAKTLKRPALVLAQPVEEEGESRDETEVVEIASTVQCTQESLVAPEELAEACRRLYKKPSMRKPAASQKKPAKQSKAPRAKPAEGCQAGHQSGWQPSASFGLVKQTRANKKAYIQYKPEEGKKPMCLVNVEMCKSATRDEVMDALWQKAKEGQSLEKADLVGFKNNIMPSK